MKPGVEHSVGVVDVVVTNAMVATLDAKTIHPVYSTFWLAYHVELAARRAIESFFELDENAVGNSLSLEHRAMAGIGAHVRITAKVTEVRGRHVLCTIEAWAMKTNTLIAEGTQGQICLSTSFLNEKCANAAI